MLATAKCNRHNWYYDYVMLLCFLRLRKHFKNGFITLKTGATNFTQVLCWKNNHLLSFCPYSITWTDARVSCGYLGSNADLVSIHSLAENAFVANDVLNNSAFSAWIGLSDRGVLYGKSIAVPMVRFGWNLLAYYDTSCNQSSL